MSRLDRLTSLLDHVKLRVAAAPLAEANLAVFTDPRTQQATLEFRPRSLGLVTQGCAVQFALRVDFGQTPNPLQAALPARVQIQLQDADDLSNLAALLSSEHAAQRCGAPAVLGRLGEVLVVRVLRHQIDHGVTTPGLLGGLAHPRIAPALVAIHEDPGRPWQNSDLAQVAGLSNSRFKQVFADTVGHTPASYVRRWRLTRARDDLAQGARVERVAFRYGYTAPDAFSRAFRKEFGILPRDIARG